MTRSTWLHLRLRVSFYLFPVFAFAVSQTPEYSAGRLLAVFGILHLLIYPASNGFNSYYDRDRDSIGGLEHPPPVGRDLLVTSLVLDGIALVMGVMLGKWFAWMVLTYGLASKAYSHPSIRLKASPWGGWITVAFFQGAFTYLMIVIGIGRAGSGPPLHSPSVVIPAVLSSLLFGGAYPLTQVYQHAEDLRRGDRTLSLALGIKGTFVFSAAMFAISMLGFFLFFDHLGKRVAFVLLLVFALPMAIYFATWLARVVKDERAADFQSTMILNAISATSLSGYFLALTFVQM